MEMSLNIGIYELYPKAKEALMGLADHLEF